MNVNGRQRPRIVEHHARSVIETHGRAGESWQRIIASVDVPVAGHTKVRVKCSAIVEHDQLVFAAALHSAHHRSAQGPKPLLRDAAAK